MRSMDREISGLTTSATTQHTAMPSSIALRGVNPQHSRGYATCAADPVMNCGESFPPYVMDFDHRDPGKKLFAITTGSAHLMSREKLIIEIEKCDIVCANCHALRTYASLMERRRRSSPEEWSPGTSPRIAYHRARWRSSAAMLNEIRDVPCVDCGRRFPPCVMQFDHRDPTAKAQGVTRMLMRARSVILAEVAKCDIVCTNCHRVRTYERRIAA
jgi:hypothetical protein